MIDYNELDKFYTGIEMPVITNCGGIFLELGNDISSLFYKLDEVHYADVNHKGRVVQVLKEGTVITSNYVLVENSLVQVGNKHEINKNSNLAKRLTFKSSNYDIKKSRMLK